MKKYVTSVLLYTQLLKLCNVNWAELCLPRAALSAPLPLFSHGAGQQFLLPSLAENVEMGLRCFPASLCSCSKEDRAAFSLFHWIPALEFWRAWAGIYTHVGRNDVWVAVSGTCFTLWSQQESTVCVVQSFACRTEMWLLSILFCMLSCFNILVEFPKLFSWLTLFW